MMMCSLASTGLVLAFAILAAISRQLIGCTASHRSILSKYYKYKSCRDLVYISMGNMFSIILVFAELRRLEPVQGCTTCFH